MDEILSAVFRGLTFGSIYALLAVGLVLTYKTAGVFNLAFGAQAFVAGAVYYEARTRHDWPIPLAVRRSRSCSRAAARVCCSTGCCSGTCAPRRR